MPSTSPFHPFSLAPVPFRQKRWDGGNYPRIDSDRSKSSTGNVERKLARDGFKRVAWTPAARNQEYTLINFAGESPGEFRKSDNKGDVEIRPIKWTPVMFELSALERGSGKMNFTPGHASF